MRNFSKVKENFSNYLSKRKEKLNKYLFKPVEKISIGLDIGSSLIKLVKIRFLKEKFEILDFNTAAAQTDLTPVLKTMIKPKFGEKVNLSVSGPATIIRYIRFPKINDNELKQTLQFETPKYIPFAVSEVNVGGHILKKDLPDNKMLILLAAAKKEVINHRLQLLEEVGLTANIIDLDSLALINAFNFNYFQDDNLKGKAVALLNIGALITNLNIIEDSIPLLSRDIYIAGNNFTQKISDMLELDFKSAEELKLNPDKERLDKVVAAIESVLSNLTNEIRTSFDYYESQGSSSVAKIYLSGGGSLFAGLKDMLAKQLGIEVEYWDPLRQISLTEHIDREKLKLFSKQLGVAVGLALRS